MKQTKLTFEEESNTLSPQPRLSLPKDKDLPPVIREIVSNAPQSRKIPAFVATLSPLRHVSTREITLLLRLATVRTTATSPHRRCPVIR